MSERYESLSNYPTSPLPSYNTKITNQRTPKTIRKINATIGKEGASFNSPSMDKSHKLKHHKARMTSGSGSPALAAFPTNGHYACIKVKHTLKDNDSTRSESGDRKVRVAGGRPSGWHCLKEKYVSLPTSITPNSEIKSAVNSKNSSLPLLPEKIAPRGASKHHEQKEEQFLNTFKGSSNTHSKETKLSDGSNKDFNGSNPMPIRDMPKSSKCKVIL